MIHAQWPKSRQSKQFEAFIAAFQGIDVDWQIESPPLTPTEQKILAVCWCTMKSSLKISRVGQSVRFVGSHMELWRRSFMQLSNHVYGATGPQSKTIVYVDRTLW